MSYYVTAIQLLSLVLNCIYNRINRIIDCKFGSIRFIRQVGI